MTSTKKSNKLKRKRGKKFVWHGDQKDQQSDKKPEEENPFEQHSKSKSAAKDLARREALLDEFRSLGKNTQFVDNRLGEKSSRLTEDDKMKLRYMKEQREQVRNSLANKAISSKRQ